ncbi:MAG: hypothetical protein ACR2K1_09815 [Saprospiraceae bacterium]
MLLKPIGDVLQSHFQIFLWPLFILFLPIVLGTPVAILLGFILGMLVDLMYGTPGVHASAGVFSAYARPFILAIFEPKGGFSGREVIAAPAHLGWPRFLQISGIFFLAHLFWFFSVETFTFYYIGAILLKTAVAWLLTMAFALIYAFLFNPKI